MFRSRQSTDIKTQQKRNITSNNKRILPFTPSIFTPKSSSTIEAHMNQKINIFLRRPKARSPHCSRVTIQQEVFIGPFPATIKIGGAQYRASRLEVKRHHYKMSSSFPTAIFAPIATPMATPLPFPSPWFLRPPGPILPPLAYTGRHYFYASVPLWWPLTGHYLNANPAIMAVDGP